MPRKKEILKSLSYTSVGTPTVESNAEMPSYNGDDVSSDFGSLSVTKYSYQSTGNNDSSQGSTSGSEGSESNTDSNEYYSQSRSSKNASKVDSSESNVSMSDRSSCQQSCCCIHGKPCMIGLSDSEV